METEQVEPSTRAEKRLVQLSPTTSYLLPGASPTPWITSGPNPLTRTCTSCTLESPACTLPKSVGPDATAEMVGCQDRTKASVEVFVSPVTRSVPRDAQLTRVPFSSKLISVMLASAAAQLIFGAVGVQGLVAFAVTSAPFSRVRFCVTRLASVVRSRTTNSRARLTSCPSWLLADSVTKATYRPSPEIAPENDGT